LIVFLGGRVEVERFQQALALDPPLLPARFREPPVEGIFHIRPRDEQHPIVAPFRGLPQSGLLTTPVWRYLPLEPLPQAVTVAEFETGDAAIVAADVGRGRCVLVATAASWPAAQQGAAADAPWTALPTWPSFPPLVHEMVRYVLAAQVRPRHVLVGQSLVGILPTPRDAQPVETARAGAAPSASPREPLASIPVSAGETSATRIQIEGPSHLAWSVVATATEGQTSFTSGPLPRAGVYEIRSGGARMRCVANVDPAESDLARVDPSFLEGLLVQPAVPSSAPQSAVAREQDLAWPFLALVLLMLVTEPYLAGWLSGRRP
jgi:hypothetical protein